MVNEYLVGIISDTHDHKSNIIRAVSKFNETGCSLVIHAGDYVAPFTAHEFGKLTCPFIGIFGNNDGERKGLIARYSPIGKLYEPPHEFVHYGKRFVVMHAPDYLDDALTRNDVDVIIYGHLHKIDVRKEGRPLVINPGESCSWLTNHSTIVLLDLDAMDIKVVHLE